MRRGPLLNWTSLIGLGLVGASAMAIVFLVLLGFVLANGSNYWGLISLPFAGVGVLGLALALFGTFRERGRRRRGAAGADPLDAIRSASVLAIVTWLGVAIFGLLATGTGSVAVVRATESNAFCSQACHSVMHPEATAYLESAHARIDCVRCHVGDAPESFVRAKLSGLRQVYDMLTHHVARPIPTPIRSRRSSSEMCETCHTRDHFIGYKVLARTYYRAESDEPIRLRMLMNVGGGASAGEGGPQAIHDHMLLAAKVEYISRDPGRQDIAWVRVTRSDGSMQEFSNQLTPLSDGERSALPMQQMECIDCHSRPAHAFATPARSVDAALAASELPASLPHIKEASLRALDGRYESTEAAMAGIPDRLRRFYAGKEPGVLESHVTEVARAGETLRAIYQRTIFPEMKADWRAHPDNLGHLDFPGCFRCHNEDMADASGENTLFLGCTRCHVPLTSVQAGPAVADSFIHPEHNEPFTDDEFTACTDCHDGGAGLYR